jgi:hypothetical protein
MALWLRRLAILSTSAAFVGAAIALLSVWMAPDQYCAWQLCVYNGLYPPPPPPRLDTIGLVIGPTLPFAAYWLLFVGILVIFAAAVVSKRVPSAVSRIASLVALGALALLVADARLPTISSWTYPFASCGAGCGVGLPPVRYALHSEWLFLWCLVPCCVAVVEQFLSTRLRGPHPLPPSPVGEREPNASAVAP